MERIREKKENNRLIRAVISVLFAFVLIFSLTALASAEEAGSFDAEFGGNNYATLSDAISAANAAGGGTVTLLRDVNLAECLTISKDVTLTGKYTIYRADSYTAGLFTVDAGVTLTLDGGITLDGGNEWVLDYDAFHTDIQKEEFLVSGMSYVTAEPSAPVATAHMISIYGSLVMNKATVQNNYGGTSLTTAPFRLYQGATLTMNDGAVARHNYIKGDSALVHCNSRYATWTINDGAEITENYSTGVGGLSFFYYSYVEMNGGEMHDNYVCGKEGSIFKLYNGARFTMNDGYIHDNYAFVMSGEWGGTISVHYTSDAATTGNYSTFTMNGGVVGPNYGNGRTTLVGNGYNKPLLYLNGGKVINVDGYNGVSGSYLYYTADSGVMEGGTIEGDSVDIRKDFTNNGTINSNVNLINKANATVYGNGVVNGNLYLDPDKNTVSACISGCTWNGDVILSNIANAVLSGGTYNGNIIVPDGATLSITGGQFKNSPIEYLAAGSQSFYDAETGLYTVYSGNVASFGGAEYETLAEAIAAANAVGGGEVALLRPTYLAESISVSSDITLSGAYSVVRSDSYTGNLFTVDAGATLTLDGGITLDGGNEWVFKEALFNESYANNGVDISSLVYVTPETEAPIATAPICYISGTVIMNKATVKNHYAQSQNPPFVVSGGSLIMNDGALATENANTGGAAVVYTKAGGTFTMNDGVEICYNYSNAGDSGIVYALDSTITMNGGDVHHNYQTRCAGLFLDLDGTTTAVMNGGHIHDNTQVVIKGKVGGVIYTDAVSFTMNGGVIERNYSNGATCIYADVGCALYLNAGIIRQENRAVIDNYTLLATGVTRVGENMLIEGAWIRFSHNDFVIDGEISSRVQFRNITEAANITGVINGDIALTGTINTVFSSGTYNGNFIIPTNTSIVISGGVYNGAFSVADGADFSIRGGRFKQNPTEYLADYHEAIYDASTGFYTINKYYEASFDGVNYDSLEEAIAAANTAGGGRVTLLHDVDLDASITVSADVEIFGEYTIFRSKSYTDNLFTVSAGATLTLDGGITLDGGNEWTIDMDLLNACMAENGLNVKTTQFVTAEAGAPKATTYAIKINGHVVMNNATVKNHYTVNENASVFYISAGASMTMNSGATATHNCSDQNMALVHCAANGDWIINDGADVSYNHAAEGNGGVAWIRGRLTMNGGDVHHNTHSNGAGAFVIIYGGGLFTMNGGSVRENTCIVASGKVAGVIYVYDGTKFVMNGGVIEKNYSNGNTGIYAKAATSSLELNAGIIRQELRATASTGYTGLAYGPTYIGKDMLIEGGVFRFSKGDFVMDGTMNCDVQIRNFSGDIDINGTIDGDASIDGSIAITISGGNWLGEFSVVSGSTLAITGGSFRENPSEWIGDAYGAIYDPETEMYNVVETAKASINGVEYNSIAEAVAAANDGDTILIMASHRIRNGVDIDKDVTIDMNNQSIISADTVDVAFRVLANVSLNGNGLIDTDNGITDVFEIGDDTVEGSLTIANGRYVGENSVAALVNGSLIIDGGEFAVNPDVADGETPDCSKLIDVDVSSADGAKKEVLVKGGSFHRFNPGDVDTSTGSKNFVDESYDSIESGEDIFSVITHSFTEYFSDNNATCEHDGTKTAKCDNCDTIHTIVDEGTGGHRFSVYISDQNSTCQSKGTKTAKCDRCDATDTQEGDKYGRHQYNGVKCQNCSRGQITNIIIIAMAIGVGGFAVWFMGFDRMFRPF